MEPTYESDQLPIDQLVDCDQLSDQPFLATYRRARHPLRVVPSPSDTRCHSRRASRHRFGAICGDIRSLERVFRLH